MKKIKELLNNLLGTKLISIRSTFDRCDCCDKILDGQENTYKTYCNYFCALSYLKEPKITVKPLKPNSKLGTSRLETILDENLRKLNDPRYL